jgi:hypothetical protein
VQLGMLRDLRQPDHAMNAVQAHTR